MSAVSITISPIQKVPASTATSKPETVKELEDLDASIRALKRNRLHSTRKIAKSLEPYFQINYYRISDLVTPVTHRPKIFSHWKLYYNTGRLRSAEMNSQTIELTEYPYAQLQNSHKKIKKLDSVGEGTLTAILENRIATEKPYKFLTNNCQHFVRKILKDYYNVQYYSKLRDAYVEKKRYYATESTQAKKIEKRLQKYTSSIEDICKQKIPPHLTLNNIVSLYNIFNLFRTYKNALPSSHTLTLLDTSLPEDLALLKCSLSKKYFDDAPIDGAWDYVDAVLGALFDEMTTTSIDTVIAKYNVPVKEGDSIAYIIKKTIIKSLTDYFF